MTAGDCPPIRPEAEESRRGLLRQGLLIAGLALVLNFVGNGRVGLWDRDEPRYAESVREMRARGDWMVPQFNGEPRYHKPIFIYWVMGLGTAIGGDNPFGARLGSALAGTAACLVVWWLGRRMLGATPAFIGTIALVTSPIWVTESKLATTDATLAFLLVVAQACLWELGKRASTRVALAFWAALALACLTKGPVGPALIATAGLASWWFGGPTACWSRLRWRWGLALFAAITLPWFVMIGISSNGDFYRFAVGQQVIQRLQTGMEDHGGFPGYYLALSIVTFYPWSALVPAAVVGAWTRRKASPAFGFLLGWVVGPLILLELVKTKLIHYYLPAFPAMALLVGWLVTAVSLDVMSIRRWTLGRLALGLLAGLGVATTAGLVAGAFILPSELRSPCLSLAALLIAGTLVATADFHRGQPILATRKLAASWAVFMIAFSGWFLPLAEPHRLSRVVGEKLARLAEVEGAKPVLVTFQEPGVIYAMRRNAPTMRSWDEIDRQLTYNRAIVTAATPPQVVSLSRDGRFVVDVLESIDGFNVNKGQVQPIRLVRITASASSIAVRSVEQPKVK